MKLNAYFYGNHYYSGDSTRAMDILFPNHNFNVNPVYNFTMAPEEKRCFEITIVDDNIAEGEHYFDIDLGYYVANDSEPRRLCGRRHIYLYDNDGE